jgi:Na+/H+ antiporter NhaB
MQTKLSPQVAVAVVAVVLVVVLALGTVWYRNASGATAADEMHAAMKKTIPGQAPFSKEQMDQMRQQGKH